MDQQDHEREQLHQRAQMEAARRKPETKMIQMPADPLEGPYRVEMIPMQSDISSHLLNTWASEGWFVRSTAGPVMAFNSQASPLALPNGKPAPQQQPIACVWVLLERKAKHPVMVPLKECK